MATVLNKRDVDLQAASPRTATVNLGSTVNVNGNVTGTLDGTSVTTVVNAALSATANYFTTSTSDPTGGANGDAHFNSSTNVMWFKVSGTWTRGGTVSASEITTGTLAAARIAANSITASKISVSSLSAIAANLGTITAGDITSSSNINITGTGKFEGNGSVGGYSAAILANNGKSSANGVVSWSGSSAGDAAVLGLATSSSAYGVYGYASAASTTGVFGSAVTSSAVGVTASNSSSGTALKVLGPMTITSTALVSNLRSATCLLADNSTKWNGYTFGSATTGSATATFLANKPGSNSNVTWIPITNGSSSGYLPFFT